MEPELERLRGRVEELERRLMVVEGWVGMRPVAAPPPMPMVVPPPVYVSEPVFVAEAVVPTADTVETDAGLVWANRIGAITMILGVAFAFLYAVDNEMIGPTGRVVCGLVAAMVALLGGDQLWHRGHKVFAQGITALGICILYFSFFAAYQLYHLIPQAIAFGGAVVSTALGGALALRYDARTIAILALFGGYLSPFLISSGAWNDLFLGSYLLALNAVTLSLARRKSWISVEVMGAVGTVVLFAVWFGGRRAEMSPAFAGFAVAQFVVFALSPAALIQWAAPAVAMLAVGWMCSPGASPVYWGWAAIVGSVGMGLAWREGDDRRLAASVVGWVVGFVQWSPGGASHGSLFAGLAVGFISYLGVLVLLPTVRRTMGTYSTMAVNAVFFYGACYWWFNQEHAGSMGLLALLVAGSFLGTALYLKGSRLPPEMMLVSAGWALAFVTLAIPIQMTGFSITLAWAVECGVLAFVAMRLQNQWAFAASWIVGVLAVVMVFGKDAGRAWGANYSPVLNARFVPFVVLALGLGANAYWTSKLQFLPRVVAGVPLVAAHFVMLAGLHLEAFAWIGTGDSKMAFASSVLMALYGLGLMGQGMARNFRLHRVLGLGLFALVVVKLYFYDIGQLDRFYRVLAFVVLGALLLSGSFLYSRYRHRLLALLQNDDKA